MKTCRSGSGKPKKAGLLEGRMGANTRTTVRTKLRNAFAGIAAFSVLSALVGVYSYQAVSTAQQSIIEEALPSARNVEQFVEEGNAVAVFMGSLAAANSLETLEERKAYLALYEEDMLSHLSTLNSYPSARDAVDELRSYTVEIFATLKEKTTVVERRIRLATLRDEQSETVLSSGRHILAEVLPAIADARLRSSGLVEQIRLDLAGGEQGHPEPKERFEQLIEKELSSLELLTAIRFRTVYLIDEVEALLLNKHTGTYAEERSRIESATEEIALLANELDDGALQAVIAENLRKISQETSGDAGMVGNHFAILRLNEKLENLSAQNRLDVEQLRILDEDLKKSVDVSISNSIAAAERSLWVGRASLIAIAVAAFVSAIWVFWRYVLSDVTARLDRIARVTRQYSLGEMTEDLTDKGNDELGDIAGALQLFKAYSVELRRSNADLEKFAYAASHDLKAPLRGVSNLAAWIEEDSGDRLSDDSRMHLALLKGRVNRLGALLEGLLNYSRAGRQKSELRNVDLKKSVQDTFDLIAVEQGFKLELDCKVPPIRTAEVLFEQVVGNLISNAIKHHDRKQGSITVECNPSPERLEFRVSDDGPGIEQQYHERVFGVFQTIKSRDEVEGSGIGLSIVKRVLESVGCEIKISSNPEVKRGASFVFTWPVVWP